MASHDSGYNGNNTNQPVTPKKTPRRSANRQIIRWTDDKIAYAFAEFRLAAQRHRIDIKKPMDDAAKFVADFVTGDALVQQLTKRRKRYLEVLAEEEAKGELPLSASAQKSTPKKRKTGLKLEMDDEDESSLSFETPSSAVKRSPRSAVRNSREIIKDESDSEYTESPNKTKNKRVRGKKGKATKKFLPKDSDESDESDDEFVDETGGVNIALTKASPVSSPLATTPSRNIASMQHHRQRSFHEHYDYGYNANGGMAPDQLQQISMSNAMMAQGTMWPGSTSAISPPQYNMVDLMNGPLHPAFHSNATVPSDPPQAVESSPSPVRETKQYSQHNESFSSTDTSKSNSIHGIQDNPSFNSVPSDQVFNLSGNGIMQRWDSPGLDLYSSYRGHTSGSPAPADEFSNELFQSNDTPNGKKLTDHFPGLNIDPF